MGSALERAGACFAHIAPGLVRPGAPELERYDALMLHMADDAAEINWFRPETLRQNTRPLLLAGSPDSVQRRVYLQAHVDDVAFPPFSAAELVLRLYRLTAAMGERRRGVGRSVRPCVLAADDDPDIVVYLKRVFRNLGVDAHFVSDGGAALSAARRLLPDLLMLDVGMPVLGGIDVLRLLRRDPGTRSLMTVLLTGSSDPLHVKVCAELGAVDYILKPFAHVDLTRKVRALLTRDMESQSASADSGSFQGDITNAPKPSEPQIAACIEAEELAYQSYGRPNS
jgi:CheY-like chemotaxis protein